MMRLLPAALDEAAHAGHLSRRDDNDPYGHVGHVWPIAADLYEHARSFAVAPFPGEDFALAISQYGPDISPAYFRIAGRCYCAFVRWSTAPADVGAARAFVECRSV